MKIAIAGIAIESCMFSPLTTALDDFTLWRGSALLARYPFLAAYTDITIVPLLVARALPGGIVAHTAYHRCSMRFCTGLSTRGHSRVSTLICTGRWRSKS